VIRRFLFWALYPLAVVALVLSSPGSARAANNDEDVELLVTSVLEGEYNNSQYKEALEKIQLAQQACEGKTSCSPKTRAKVYVALGTILAGGFKKTREAKDAFVIALREDPTIGLFGDYQSPDAQRAFNEARTVAKGSSGNEEQEDSERKLKKYPGGGRAPSGWLEAEAYFYFREAVISEKEREWLDCAYYAQASLSVETRPTTRFLAATCEERAGLWIEALADYQAVADIGRKTGGTDIGRQARARIKALRERVPKIIIRKPQRAENLVVKMNGDEVPPKKIGGEIWVNPGQRTITATGKVDGQELEFEQSIELAEFETASIEIKLAPKGARGDAAIIRCMAQAFTRAEFANCIGASLGGKGSGLNFSAGFEFSAYHDSDHADAMTPTLSFSVESPTSGWGAGGAFLVDVVSTASTDIVATASPPVQEKRYAPSLGGHKKFGSWDVGLHTAASIEPDYLATGGGGSLSIELAQKTITPSLGYDFGYDIQGRSGTPYSTFSEPLVRHALDAGLGIVIDKATFLALSGTGVVELGDSSKPYRYIPMFSPEIAPTIKRGTSIQSINRVRLPERVLEQTPTDRERWALAGRIAHRFASSTIRFEERLYIDNWGLKASTTDAIFFYDVSPTMRLWPHIRVNAQTGVDFWKVAYTSTYDSAKNTLTVPALRSGDRELGPLITGTVGLGGRFALGEDRTWSITAAGEFVYTRFLDHLFIQERFGYFGKTVLEVDFE
jgi:hypothetical protein